MSTIKFVMIKINCNKSELYRYIVSVPTHVSFFVKSKLVYKVKAYF